MAKLFELTFYVSYIVLVFILLMLLCSFMAGLAAEIYHNTRSWFSLHGKARKIKKVFENLAAENDIDLNKIRSSPIITKNENTSFKFGD